MPEKDTPTDGAGRTGLVFGILSNLFILFPYYGIILAILAVVFSLVALRKRKTGVATAGLVLGYVGVLTNGLMLVLIPGFASILRPG